MTLVFLLEELSMKAFLEGFLPRILPPDVHVRLVPHEGKSDLEKSIPRKLRAWRTPNTQFVVVRDQDAGDCVRIADHLRALCADAGRADTLVRIACRELEAWFLGDLQAVADAFELPRLASLQSQKKYRQPDSIGSPSRELAALVPGYGKVAGARRLGPALDVERCCSPSLAAFVRGVQRTAQAGGL